MQDQFPYTIEELCQKLDDSQDFMDKVTSGFMERNERIFYRKPVQTGDGKMGYDELTDNTLASYLEKMPKNVIQRLPTFTLDAHTRQKAENIVYEYIATEVIMRNGTSKGYGLLQKHWITMRDSATYGACAAYLPFENDHGEFTVGFDRIYWGDLYPEAYASNINSANFVQFRTLKTEEDILKAMRGLDDEEGGTWIREGLQTVLDYGKGQATGNQNENFKAQMEGLPNGMYELFVFTNPDWVVTYHYASRTLLRVVPNRSGRKRVIGLYSDFDGSSIMGRSLVDMAYGIQQVLTSLLRGFTYTSDYNTDPAKFVKGVTLDDANFNLEKGNTMFLSEEDAEVKLLPIDTTTLQNFPNLYNLMKTVLLTSLPSSNDSGIPAGAGDPGYSRTQAGVNSQDQKAEVDNNYYRKNYEQFFEMVMENQINIYIAEVKHIAEMNDAIAEIELNAKYANLVREIDPTLISADNRVRLDFHDYKGVNVSVNFESTRDIAKEEDLKRLNSFMTGFFELAKADPAMAEGVRPAIPLLIEEMAKSSNLENSSKIVQTMKESIDAIQQRNQVAAEQEQQSDKGSEMAEVKPPTVSIAFKDLPPAGKVQAAAMYGIELTVQDLMPGMVAETEGDEDVNL